MSKFDLTRADYCPETLAVRAGQERSQFGEHSEALYLTSSFVFKSASQAAKRFSGEEEGNVYARFSNPTVTMFEERLAALEGAEDCVATASGMSAIMAAILASLPKDSPPRCSTRRAARSAGAARCRGGSSAGRRRRCGRAGSVPSARRSGASGGAVRSAPRRPR